MGGGPSVTCYTDRGLFAAVMTLSSLVFAFQRATATLAALLSSSVIKPMVTVSVWRVCLGHAATYVLGDTLEPSPTANAAISVSQSGMLSWVS